MEGIIGTRSVGGKLSGPPIDGGAIEGSVVVGGGIISLFFPLVGGAKLSGRVTSLFKIFGYIFIISVLDSKP